MSETTTPEGASEGTETTPTPLSEIRDLDERLEAWEAQEEGAPIVQEEEVVQAGQHEETAQLEQSAELGQEDKSTSEDEGESPSPKYTIKVHGKETEKTLEELKILAQKAEAADQRFQEAARIRKENDRLLRTLKERPEEALRQVGHDVDRLAEQRVQQMIELQMMNEDQRRAHQAQQEAAQYRAQVEHIQAQQRAAEEARIQQQYAEEYSNKISAALESSGLPKRPGSVRRVVDAMLAEMDNGNPVEASEVVHLVQKEYQEDVLDMVRELDGEKLLEVLGNAVVKKVRTADVARLKKGQAVPKVADGPPKTPTRKRKQPPPSADEFFDRILNMEE